MTPTWSSQRCSRSISSSIFNLPLRQTEGFLNSLRPSRKMVFQARLARRASARCAVRIAPVVSKKAKGVALSLAW